MLELGLTHHRKQKASDFSRVSDLISSIIRESIPESEYQRRLEMMAAPIQGSQSDLTLELLPSITCLAAAGNPAKAIPVTAAWQLIRLAAKLFDDVEDGEIGDRSAEVNNLATVCLFVAHVALEKLPEYGISRVQSQRVRKRFTQACLQTCNGQDVDLSTRWDRIVPTPDDWLEIARAKSGVLFAWASWAGAVVAGASQETQVGFWDYGLHLGILVQIADDYNGIWNSPIKSDLSSYRVTLPISYAHFVANQDDWSTLLNLLREANLGIADAATKGRALITALGTQKFILAAAQVQRHEAVAAISHKCLSNRANRRLSTLLEKIFPALIHLPLPSHETSTRCMANSE